MWISRIRLSNIKSFDVSPEIDLSRNINILLGANNAGKSVLIKALLMLQDLSAIPLEDIRIGANEGDIIFFLQEISKNYVFTITDQTLRSAVDGQATIRLIPANTPKYSYTISNGNNNHNLNEVGISNMEPNNFIYTFLSKRKAVAYSEQVTKTNANQVGTNLINIVSKIDRLSNPQHPFHQVYRDACERILGFFVSIFPSSGGKQAGIIVNNFDGIPLGAMGEGVASLAGIIVDLCLAENKLFLIEELENDIHPQALKRLLELIIQKSETNQFVISTHSNIVTRYLGAVSSSKVFYVTLSDYTNENRLPVSTCKELVTPEERGEALKALGYDLMDYNLFKGWLFFEESSAERIVRDFLIPWFTPKLRGRIGTVAAQGTSDVEPRFKDFNRLFVFLHLEGAYKNCAWVIVDGESSGQDVIKDLKEKYIRNGWNEEQFIVLSQNDFEYYYPSRFREKAIADLSIRNKKEKKKAKEELFNEVVDWIISNEEDAREEFSKSASEIIDILHSIEEKMFPG